MPCVPLARGLGRQLVSGTLDHARFRPGVQWVRLAVTEGNAAPQALYARCGLATFGVEPMAVAVDGGLVSKVHMWHALSDAPVVSG